MQKKSCQSRLSSITLSELSLHDIPSIVQIEAKVSTNPWNNNLFINELNQKGAFGFVANTVCKKVIGFALCKKIIDELEIIKIAVSKEYQHRGIGTRLLKRLFSCELATSALRAYLEVKQSSITAQKFYEKMGFRTRYIRKKYYNNNDDALVMFMVLT